MTFLFFEKSDFYKNYNKICKILIFFSSNLFKKSGIKNFLHIFLDVILFKIWYSLIRYKNFWNLSSCSLVIVHASLKNMVSRKTRLKFLVTKTGDRTWRDKKIHDFHNFSNSSLKFYMRISECMCNRIMMKKKYRFFYPLTGEAPLKFWIKPAQKVQFSFHFIHLNVRNFRHIKQL